MNRIGKAAFAGVCGVFLLVAIPGAATRASAQAQQAAPAQKPAYTTEEYNAYMKAKSDTDNQQKIKDLDDFVAKYPNSALLIYVYNDYYNAYYALKDYPKTIEYIDKLLAMNSQLDPTSIFRTQLARAQTFLAGASLPELSAPDQQTKARDDAQEGLKDLAALKKPDNVSDADFQKQKAQITGVFDSVIATADYNVKDWNAAADAYKTLIAADPTDAGAWSRMGIALLQQNPPQTMPGYWALAHAISMLKPPADQQIRAYLKNQVLRYQQVGCENLVDDEINQMVTMAGSSPDMPSTFTIPSADDLTKARNDTTDFIPWLKEGGDHGKLMWLATCGLDYPEVVAKVISVDPPTTDTGPVVLHLCTGATPDETEACKTADMVVNVVDQPDAKRVQPDDGLRFEGTLSGYDPNPFMLHWEKGKVNPEDIPEPGKAKPKKKGTK
jgi:tetratricopeptide (TPR) repeat protein